MSTICIDVKRVDDNYVCIYQAEHNHFAWSTHLPQSSWNNIIEDDADNNYRYNYFIVAKNSECGDIEEIIYSSFDKTHTYDILKGCQDKNSDALYYDERYHDYRIIRVAIYRFIPYSIKLEDGKIHRGYALKVNKLKDEYKLYCPKDLNKKYRVYGTYGERKKNGKGCYWQSPRTLRRK